MASLNSIQQWDDEIDVLIVGFGLSGAVAAIEAIESDPSASVMIIEKNPERLAGGNSRASGQTLFCPDDVEATMAYQQAMNQPNPVPEDILRVWAEAMASQESWIERMAAEAGNRYVHHGSAARADFDASDPPSIIVEFPELPGSEAVKYNSTIEPAPSGVWNTFKFHVDRRPIRVEYESRAVDIIQDPDSLEVYGMIVEQGARRRTIKARRATVMCTGSFEANPEMQRNYWGSEAVYTLGNPANTGDGVKMLQKAGADMWHLRNFNQSGGIWPSIKVPEFDAVFFRNIRMVAKSWIEIAIDNNRFYDEATDYALTHFRMKRHGHWVDTPHAWALPVHLICDEPARLAQPFTTDWMGWNIVVEGYEWSNDNSAEIERGWIKRADSIEELSKLMDREPGEVRATIDRFNEAARTGHDPEFGRDPKAMAPIEKPPFYSVGIVPGVVAHTGGGKRDAAARVLDHDGEPIPRLYEAGELGSTMANLYQNGSFLTECMVFGRIAGRSAAQQTSWDALGAHVPAKS